MFVLTNILALQFGPPKPKFLIPPLSTRDLLRPFTNDELCYGTHPLFYTFFVMFFLFNFSSLFFMFLFVRIQTFLKKTTY